MIRSYIILFIISIFIPCLISGQSLDHLYQLYHKKQYSDLKKQVETQKGNSPDLLFFRTLFVESGDQAITTYESLLKKSQGRLQKLVAQKISEYYYAKGYYVKASEYSQISSSVSSEKIIPMATKKIYRIQVGAFGYKDNAIRMKDLLEARDIVSKIEMRDLDGKSLYCVWIDGKTTYNETKSFAEELKQKYKLKYQIINP